MPLEQDQGIVLKRIDFKDQQKIMTLYTPKRGLISLMIKGFNRKKSYLLNLSSPLTIGEYYFHIGKSNLYQFKDGTLLFTNTEFRKSWDHLQAATSIAQSLLTSQFPGKPSPNLYQLTVMYLRQIRLFAKPEILTGSYFLKLLQHEGLFNKDQPDLFFTSIEWEALLPLINARNFSSLHSQTISPPLQHKIETFFRMKME